MRSLQLSQIQVNEHTLSYVRNIRGSLFTYRVTITLNKEKTSWEYLMEVYPKGEQDDTHAVVVDSLADGYATQQEASQAALDIIDAWERLPEQDQQKHISSYLNDVSVSMTLFIDACSQEFMNQSISYSDN